MSALHYDWNYFSLNISSNTSISTSKRCSVSHTTACTLMTVSSSARTASCLRVGAGVGAALVGAAVVGAAV
jgi:hypothetical protein